MAFVRLLKDLMKDKNIGQRFRADRSRRGAHLRHGLRCSRRRRSTRRTGSATDPVDAELLLSYKEDTRGQILHEGISESGSMASVIAAGRRTPPTASR